MRLSARLTGAFLAGSASLASAQGNATSPSDTLHLTVGSPQVDGRIYVPHAGRVTKLLLRGDRVDTTAVWVNILELGDSAGRPVHRWHTGGWSGPPGGARTRFDLWSTFDAATLALLGWHLQSASGARARLAIDGRAVRGELRTPADSAAKPVEFTLAEAGFAAGAADLIPYAVGLREGLVVTLPLWSPPGRKLEREVWAMTGRDSVAFAGRSVPAWVMEHRKAGGERVLGRIWFVDEPPYVVRWELFNEDGSVTRMIGERRG